MNLRIITVGKIKDKSIDCLIRDLSAKIRFDAKLDLLEIKDSGKESEGKKIIDVLEKVENSFVFALSEEGIELNSVDFSKKLKKLSLDNKTLTFVIGGPFGLSHEVKEKADVVLSMSKMTFTHEMAKLFLLEQIYRAISIIKNRNYHKG